MYFSCRAQRRSQYRPGALNRFNFAPLNFLIFILFCYREYSQLVSDPIENTQQLNEQLRALGLYPAPTLGDGNCLFRALSDQYYGSPSQHLRLREEICDWIQAHKLRYEPFVLDERGLDVHLRCMRQPGMPPS